MSKTWKRECQRQWYLRNREMAIERSKEWQQVNKERTRELKRAWAKRNRPQITLNQRARKYNLTSEELRAIYQAHNGLCDICGNPPNLKRPLLNIDHNHNTGEVRGLLCTPCNIGVGWAEKFARNLDQFMLIIQYLR